MLKFSMVRVSIRITVKFSLCGAKLQGVMLKDASDDNNANNMNNSYTGRVTTT